MLLEPGRRGGAARIGGWTDNYLRVDLGEGEAETRLASVEITGLGDNGLTGIYARPAATGRVPLP